MGKVYDALRRAEEQRGRRLGETAPPASTAPGADWSPPAARTSRVPVGRRRLFGNWLARRRERAAAREASGDVNKRRIALLQPESFVAEQFRTLRARLDSVASQRPLRTLSVTSSLAGEGKTTAAINLAAVTAMGVGRRVLLVDCDLRTPKVADTLGLRPEAGLAEVLTEEAVLEQARIKVERLNLEVVAVRGLPSNPSELLASDRMRSLLEEFARSYDRVILDLPPALGLPDAKTVSELTDGIVMIVRADTTPEDDIQSALDVLDRRRILGVVLNGARMDETRYGYR